MNKKILAELLTYSQNKIERITPEYIKETFDVDLDEKYQKLEDYVEAIDNLVLDRYFSKYWSADMKKWKYSGVQLIDEVNNLKPRAVLDVGCGYNEFKGKIKNLTGIDPYNVHADWKIHLKDYKTKIKYDVILCLGSINFGSRSKIESEIEICVNLLEKEGVMFFRVNPGVQHYKPESYWVDFFAWNVPFIIEMAEKFGLKILDIRDDTNQRKYFVLRKQ